MRNFLHLILLLGVNAHAYNSSLQQSRAQLFERASAPRNYIKNSGAERNDLLVTDADAIVSRTTTTPMEGVGSFTVDADASGEKAIWTADDLQEGLLGQSCEATANFIGDASLYKAYVTLAGTTVSAETTLTNSGTSSQAISLIFPCGASTTADPAFVIEATSASAASIEVDSVYLGKALGIGSGFAITPWRSYTPSNSQGLGTLSAVDLQWRQVGDSVELKGTFTTGTSTASEAQLALPNNYTVVSSITSPQIAGFLTKVASTTGTSSVIITGGDTFLNFSGGIVGGGVNLLTPQGGTTIFGNTTVYTLETVVVPVAELSANTILRGDAPGVGWTAFTPTVTYASGGATNVTHTGWYKCGTGGSVDLLYQSSFSAASAAFGGMFYSFPSGFTPRTDTPTAVLGRVRFDDDSSGGYSGIARLVSNLVFIQYQNVVTHAGTAPVKEDVNPSNTAPFTFGSNDIITVNASVPVTAASPCPKLPQAFIPGSVYSSSQGIEKTNRARIANNGSVCSITSQSGTWLTSATRNGAGVCDLVFAANTFSAAPSCTATRVYSSGNFKGWTLESTPATTSGVSIAVWNELNTGTDDGFDVICQGAN